ncbi:MAG: hypothetical protein ACI9U6_000416 [Loktanella salsilacus]|jgi:hypothetical protein
MTLPFRAGLTVTYRFAAGFYLIKVVLGLLEAPLVEGIVPYTKQVFFGRQCEIIDLHSRG